MRRELVSLIALASVAATLPNGRAQSPWESGAAGAWHKLKKLQSIASVMHTTAHPDDEHGGVLAALSRGQGARVALLTLTRGESGDNAIGPELFDELGLIRTEELLVSNRYYGVDEQYFGTVVDYGFSKRLDEAIEKWGKEHVLRDVVRVIRMERPLVIISRFQGSDRDGHGNHAAAGLVTKEAFELAGNPKAFPDQITDGLRPWQPLKLYTGGVRANEDWTIRLDTGEYDAVLGESYQSFARFGLSFQRSQNGGRVSRQPGSSFWYYKLHRPVIDPRTKERTFFDGIDTAIPGLYRALRRTAPPDAERLLTSLQQQIEAATAAFKFSEPSAAAPALARALTAVRQATTELGRDEDVRFVLALKERQISDAIAAVLGVNLTGTAQPEGTPEGARPFAGGPPPMPPVVPGQRFDVRATFVNSSPLAVKVAGLELVGPDSWTIAGTGSPTAAARNQPVVTKFTVTVPETAALSRPHFFRRSIQDTRYTMGDDSQRHRPSAGSPIHLVARYEVEGVLVEARRPVTRLESNVPYGHDQRELAVVPAIAVALTPSHVVAPIGTKGNKQTIRLTAEVLNNREGTSAGTVRLNVPSGWSTMPGSHSFQFSRAGERARFSFDLRVPVLESREYRVDAVATSAGRDYREGYRAIRHRDLETRYSYRDAVASVRGVDVRIVQGQTVGYVMGIGDDVPSALAQLGVNVELLGEQDLATGNLDRYRSIITGTRAYAVRDDLKTYNRRLLDYVRNGGNLIVLYNTQELVPALYAPYPGELPGNAEEVSEEDSPVEILAPDAAVLRTPNRITAADFDNWVEQRGSKFWSSWSPEYSAVIATHDRNQAPQKGGWLHARYGKGHYTYFAYALHRQLPYGVSGAYRILANLLSLGAL